MTANSEKPRLALLDRDGTLVDVVRDEETGTITTAFHPGQLKILDGVVEGLRLLVDAGYRLAIVTNQPGPAKGYFSRDAVERTNAALVAELAAHALPVARVGVCLHHPEGGKGGDPALVGPCACRKPGWRANVVLNSSSAWSNLSCWARTTASL